MEKVKAKTLRVDIIKCFVSVNHYSIATDHDGFSSILESNITMMLNHGHQCNHLQIHYNITSLLTNVYINKYKQKTLVSDSGKE